MKRCLFRLRPPHLVQTRAYAVRLSSKDLLKSRARQDLLCREPEQLYPRITKNDNAKTVKSVVRWLEQNVPKNGQKMEGPEYETIVRGRITSIREASRKLSFYDIVQDGSKLQIVVSYKNLYSHDDHQDAFTQSKSQHRVGDIVEITGYPGRSEHGGLSIYASKPVALLAPCLHTIPETLSTTKALHAAHVASLVSHEPAQILRLRSCIINRVRNYFLENSFTEVSTPILSPSVGGATANPFLTSTATSLSHGKEGDVSLALRIAPELWLKRLIISGVDRVFEIGPQFRNEGIDITHNPEFTTCEFYQAYADLDSLIATTQELFKNLATYVEELKKQKTNILPDEDFLQSLKHPSKWGMLEFCPALEEAMGRELPILDGRDDEDVVRDLVELYTALELPLPNSKDRNTPHLLDKLAEHYLEPLCLERPTFITYHPAALSPLAKTTWRNGRHVSVRFEFYIDGQELVNAYEEENSPDEQRRKFALQSGEVTAGDEDYCAALEWGLPPTGGWGLGIDRLIMMFARREKIQDVLAFGGLRGVVAQSGGGRSKGAHVAGEVKGGV